MLTFKHRLTPALCTSLVFASLAVSALAPIRANAGCLADGLPVACEYPPYSDDFGPVTDTSGIDDEFAAAAGAPVNDILHRVTIRDTGIYVTEATCNDGSPAVIYVRKALNQNASDKWVIVLEGGGTGFDARQDNLDQGMWDRWTGPDLLDWYRKASTDWFDASTGTWGRDDVVDMPEEIVVGGLLDSGLSSFADWNWVYLNYCSSDAWTGAVSEYELPGAGSWTDSTVFKQGFMMDFNGHRIIEATLSLLRHDVLWAADADPEYVMPNINDATRVLFAGESAGGGGVRHNLDYVQAELWSTNAGVEVSGSIGAGLKPEPGDLADPWAVDDYDQAGDPFPNGVDDIIDAAKNQYNQIQDISGFLDDSCKIAMALTPADDDWSCVLTSSLLSQITSRVFVKQDFGDSLVGRAYTSMAVYGQGLRERFDAFDLLGTPPYFGPRCNTHATLTNGNYFGDVLEKQGWTGAAPDGVVHGFMSYDDALRHFVDPSLAQPFAYHGKVFTESGVDYVWVSSC